MERAIFPPAITIPLHQIRFPLLIGEVDRHRQSGKPLTPKIYPITLPVEWASYINTFPTGSHRHPSEIACVLMAFCLHHNAGFRHGYCRKKVVFYVRVLSMFCHKKKPVFCTTFDTLLIRPIISKSLVPQWFSPLPARKITTPPILWGSTMNFHPFPHPLSSNHRIPATPMALGIVYAIHTGIMRADRSLVSTMAFIENLGNRAAWIEPIAMVPHISLLILAACKCLVHITIRCDPFTHDFVPALLPEIRTTI